MTSTDVSEITDAVSGIQITGPGEITPVTPELVEPEIIIATGETTVEFLNPDGSSSGKIPLADIPELKQTINPEALFDTHAYLDVPTVDGQAADKLVVSFSGSVSFNAGDEQGKQLFRSLSLGKSATLQVEAVVAGKAGGWKIVGAGGDMEREVVTATAKVKVETLYLPSPEDL